MYYIIDSCIWVAYFREVDSCYKEARQIIALKLSENNSNLAKNIFVPPEILIETVNTLKRRANKSVSRDFLRFIELSSQISTMPLGHLNFFDTATDWYMEQKGSLSMNDLLLVAMAIFHEFQLLTFDKALYQFYQKKLKELA